MKKTPLKKTVKGISGFTIMEILLAVFLVGVVSALAMQFYINEHNNLIVQQNVADMQQNLRASICEISQRVMNAGANIPSGFMPIQSSNADPDTLIIRYSEIGGTISVGDHTQKLQASPIHVAMGSDLSKFSVGQKVYLWHTTQQEGEWFIITNISTNSGEGWEEIYHQGQELLYDPMPGDRIIALHEIKFYVDASDTTHPILMREMNGEPPQAYADCIYDFQVQFYLNNQDTVDVLTPTDTAVVARISLSAFTAEVDVEAMNFNRDGRRRRSLTTETLIRNSIS